MTKLNSRNMAQVCLVALSLILSSQINAGSKETAKVDTAIAVLEQLASIPEDGIPKSLLRRAEGIAVIPSVIKAGFVIGGRRGKGLMSIRAEDYSWSAPVFITLTGGSVGFQAGVQSTDVVLVFKTRRSVKNIVNGKFTLGVDASIAAGPVGREANASTDLEFEAEIYSYSRSRGLFAGVALDGSALKIDYSSNDNVYGEDTSADKILAGKAGHGSQSVVRFRDLLEELTAAH